VSVENPPRKILTCCLPSHPKNNESKTEIQSKSRCFIPLRKTGMRNNNHHNNNVYVRLIFFLATT
jgi:hypothetical protein